MSPESDLKSADPYRWLENREDPRVLSHLQAESAYADSVLAEHKDLEREVLNEIRRRSVRSDISVEVPWGNFLYYSRQAEDQPYFVHCRRENQTETLETVVLDENELAKKGSYFALGAYEISPDHRYLAYGVDISGDERFELRIRNLSSGRTVHLRDGCGDRLAWAADGRTLFYTVLDDSHRAYRIYRHRLGRPAHTDELIFEEKDEAFHLELSKTESGDYLCLMAKSPSMTEVRILGADHAGASFQVLERRRAGVRYAVTHHGHFFYILMRSLHGGRAELWRAPVDRRQRHSWERFAGPGDDIEMERLLAFARFLVIFGRRDGVRQVWVRPMDDSSGPPVSGDWYLVDLPEEICSVGPAEHREFHSERLRLGYSSLTAPYSVLEVNLMSRRLTVKKESSVGGGFLRSRYVSKRICARGSDGTQIPISLVYRRDLRRPGGNPLVLYAYGAYGYSVEPDFDPSRLSLLDRGIVFAIAHVRGGGELGEAWHEAGKLLNKKRSFSDCVACAQHLARCGYGDPEKMGLMGESAGGLLVAAVLNEHPGLLTAAVADCPFVDVLHTLRDPSLPLSVSDWQEFGDPRDDDVFAYIRSYSPCDNVERQAYPALYVTSGLNDPRVAFWEPAKWVAKLRDLNTGDRPILLEMDMESGHWGSSGRFAYDRQTARKLAFLISHLQP